MTSTSIDKCDRCGRTDVQMILPTWLSPGEPWLCMACEDERVAALAPFLEDDVVANINAGRYKRAPRLKPKLLSHDNGLTVWLVQHDSQGLWLGHWYRMNCMTCAADNPYGGVEFDVREVPGYNEHRLTASGGHGALMADYHAMRRHHAEIISRAIEAGWMPERLTP